MEIQSFQPTQEQGIFKALLNAAPDATVIVNTHGIIQFVNSQTEKLFGYKKVQLDGKAIEILVPGALYQAYIIKHREDHVNDPYIRSMGAGLELEAIKKDGKRFLVEISSSSLQTDAGVLILVSIRNITDRKKAEEDLKEKEFFLRESQKAGNTGSYKLNFITGYWQSSETLDSIFGIEKNYHRSIAGWLEIVHPEDRQKMDEYFRLEVIGKQKSFNREYRIKRINDQQTRWVCGIGGVIFDDGGNITEMIGTIQDITERKHAENALRESEETFRQLFNESADPILLLDDTGFSDCNQSAASILGYSAPQDVLLKQPWEISPEKQPDGRLSTEKAKAMIAIALQNGYNRFEWVHTKLDKTEFPVEVMLTPITLRGKQFFYTIWRDISERKKAEKELKESEERYRSLVEQASDGILVGDFQGNIIEVNSALCSMFGYTREKVLSKKMNFFLESNDLMLNPINFDQLQKGDSVLVERRAIHNDGSLFDIELSSKMIGEGKLLSIIRDITERKKAEQDLSELTTRLQLATSSAKIGIFDWDISKNNLVWDENMYQIFGVSPDQFRGAFEAWSDTVHPDDIQNGLAEVQAAIDGTKDFHTFFRILWKNKEVRYVEGHATILRDAEGKATRMIGINRDITEQKRAEEAIRENNERYEFVNKATQDIIWEWDYRTHKGKWGEGIITTFGYSEDKLNYGENWIDEFVHPDDKELLLKDIRNRIDNSSQICQNEYRFLCADGSYKYVFDRGYILYDENKKPYRMIGAMTDVTEKKRLERELAEQQIKQ